MVKYLLFLYFVVIYEKIKIGDHNFN